MRKLKRPVDLDRPIPFGPFEIHQLLGHGGMGVVWRGVHVEQGLPVAIKALPGQRARRDTYFSIFRDEVRKVAQFSHPGIVMVFDFGEVSAEAAALCRTLLPGKSKRPLLLEEASPYLVMEFCEGGSLEDRLNVLPWADIRGVLLALLDALAHAHARGVVHRDIKPDNILFTADPGGRPAVKLTDFGVALSGGTETLTTAERVVGTLPYMAPEQFGDWREHGPWTDLYALGCVAYRLVSGRPPFRGHTPAEYAGQHLFEDPPPLSLPADVPAELAGWVLRLLQKDPRERFPCAADAAGALVSFGDPAEIETSRYTWEITTIRVRQRAFASGEWDAGVPAPREVPSGEISGERAVPMPLRRPPLPDRWRNPGPPPVAMSLVGAGIGLYGWRALPLIGREPERDRIWAALQLAAKSGRPRVVVLQGEAGYGKSRLAEWAAQRALELGAVTEALRAEHAPIAGPAHGLPAMLAEHLRCVGLDREAMGERIEGVLRGLGVEDPYEAAALLRWIAAGPGADPGDPTQRYALVQRTLGRLGGGRPVIVVLEDVQWGSDALGLAQHLVATQEEFPAPLLVIATVRSDLLAERPLEAERLAELQALDGVEALAIGPLPPREHGELVQSLLRLEGDLAAQVSERTGGNPLFAVQLVGDWVSRGVLRVGRTGFALRRQEQAAIPERIHGLWRGRVERALAGLGSDATRALLVAAALGRDVAADDWHEACAELDVAIPDGLSGALQRAHLIEPRKRGLRFCHGMLCESLRRDALAAGEWTRVNGACAAMLQRRPDARGRAQRIGRHLVEADRPREALDWLLLGAEERLQTSDYRDAGALVDRGEAILRQLDVDDADPRWGPWWIARIRVDIGLGRHEQAAHLAARAAETARRRRWTGIFPAALRYQAMALQRQGDLGLAETVLVRAQLEATRAGDELEEARCLQHLSSVARLLGDARRALEVAREGFARFEALDHPSGMADCLAEAGNASLELGDRAAAARDLRGALQRFEQIGSAYGIARCHNSLGDILRDQGDLRRAQREYQRAQSILERVGSPQRIVPLLNHGLLWLKRGHPEEARAVFEVGQQIVERLQRRHLECYVHGGMLACLAAGGEWDAWDRRQEQLAALLGETGAVASDLAWPLEQAGDRAREAGHPLRARAAYRLALEQWQALEQDGEARRVEARLAALPSAAPGED